MDRKWLIELLGQFFPSARHSLRPSLRRSIINYVPLCSPLFMQSFTVISPSHFVALCRMHLDTRHIEASWLVGHFDSRLGLARFRIGPSVLLCTFYTLYIFLESGQSAGECSGKSTRTSATTRARTRAISETAASQFNSLIILLFYAW